MSFINLLKSEARVVWSHFSPEKMDTSAEPEGEKDGKAEEPDKEDTTPAQSVSDQ